MGYFIGDGLKNFKNPKGSFSGYPTLIKDPEVPKVELKGTTYYQYQQFIELFSTINLNEK